MSKSVLQKFIQSNPRWYETLSQKPYAITIRNESGNKVESESDVEGLILMKYNQIDSDFSIPEVQEARGIILDSENDFNVVCKPFNKFFNIQEGLAADIDWSTARTFEKVDGSIVKLFFHPRKNVWQWASNGVIDASRVEVMFPSAVINTMADMIHGVIPPEYDFRVLDTSRTYIFELVGPHNRVVVPYENIGLYYLGEIDNETLQEDFNANTFMILKSQFPGMNIPHVFDLSTYEECQEFLSSEYFNNFHNEGFVVCDANFNRVKIKTEEYVRVHRLRGENNPTDKNILDIIRQGETSEFLSYFPEYTERFRMLEYHYKNLIADIYLDVEVLNKQLDLDWYMSRKDIASIVKKMTLPGFMFAYIDGKATHVEDFLRDMQIEKLLKILS